MPDTAIAEAPAKAASGGNILQVRNLEAWYGESHILHGINFDVNAGEVVTLFGGAAGEPTPPLLFVGAVLISSVASVTESSSIPSSATTMPLASRATMMLPMPAVMHDARPTSRNSTGTAPRSWPTSTAG